MTEDTLTVDCSQFNHIPEGDTFEVVRDHTNQFTDRRVLTLRPVGDTTMPLNRGGPHFQVERRPDDDVWTEIHVGLRREHEEITFEENL